jgi:hypothetical protein
MVKESRKYGTKYGNAEDRNQLDEEIKDDRSTRKMDQGQLSKWEKSIVGCFGAP